MTAKKPNAWAVCGCGNRMRTSNAHGMCGQCHMKEKNAENCRRYYHGQTIEDVTIRQENAARQLAATAIEEARENEHEIEVMLQDTEPGGWIGFCETCDLFLVIDPTESGKPYGGVTDGPCPGPQVQPAVRRLESSYFHASTSAANEGASRRPPHQLGGFPEEERKRWA